MFIIIQVTSKKNSQIQIHATSKPKTLFSQTLVNRQSYLNFFGFMLKSKQFRPRHRQKFSNTFFSERFLAKDYMYLFIVSQKCAEILLKFINE